MAESGRMEENRKRYFGGSASDFGSVKALEATDFRRLVEGTLVLARRLSVTREEFRRQDKKRRDSLKRTAFLVAARMASTPSERLAKRARGISLVFLDVDDPSHARPLLDSPSALSRTLEPFSFAIYTTANHSPESPRVRLVVDADISDPGLYPAAVETVAAMAGVPAPTVESKVAVQAMYLPVVFADEDPDAEHPLLHWRTDGRPMGDADVDPTLEGAREGVWKGSGELVDALEFLTEPVEGLELETAEAMLRHLDPDLPYSDWLKVCFALKHQFGATADEDDALDLFDLWSAGGSKYAGRDDVLAKWKSARSSSHGDGRSPVTMRTVMRMATARGWSGGNVSFEGFEGGAAAVEAAVRSLAVAGLPSIAEEAALADLAARAKRTGCPVGLPVLRKALASVKKSIAAFESGGDPGPPPAWARGFVHVAVDNAFHRCSTGEVFGPDPLDAQFGRFLLEKAGPGEDDPSMGSRPPVRPRDFLLNVLKVPTVYGTSYDPRRCFDHVVERNGRTYLNVYRPTWPDPDEAGLEAARAAIGGHLKRLVAEPAYRRTLLDWMAWQVQRPGEKVRWAVLVQGAQGCGKTFLLDVLACALGRENVKAVEASVLFSSQYNDWAVGAQVVGFEEIRVVGHNRHEVMNRLKPVVTNDRVMVNRKFRDLEEHDNVTNYMLFTNHHDSLAVADGDRRYFVLEAAMQTRAQVQALPAGYFPGLYRQLAENAGGVRAWLEGHRISDSFDPHGHAPRTRYFEALVGAAASEEAASVKSAIAGRRIVNSSELAGELAMEGVKIGPQALAGILRGLGFVNAGRRVHGGSRRTLWAEHETFAELGEAGVWAEYEDGGASPLL